MIQGLLPGLIVVCFGQFLGPRSPVPKCEEPGAPISAEEHTSMAPRSRKVRILHFKNLPPFRDDPSLQIRRLRYSPGLAPTTRLNALLNAAWDSYPTNRPTSMTFFSRFCSNFIAFCIRHSVTYSSGVCPSSSLKRAANAERDMPAASARDATVQGVFTLS